MVWRGLQAARFISKDDAVGGTDYKYWRHQLGNLTDETLKAGLKASSEFTGVMTWSAFQKLCLDATRVEPCHKPAALLPHKSAGPAVARKHLDDLFRACPELCPERHRERLGI